MNAKQKIHQASLTKWAALVHDQKESGLTIDTWCEQEGISKHSYYYWKHALKEEALKSVDLPEIVPILPPSSPTLPVTSSTDLSYKLYNSSNPNQTPAISVSLGDIRIEIGANASDELISGIIKAVRHA
ncbi:MAG: hypothetical protein K6E48_03400 [Lachnospiraceae bacterium]|nr:hypothetical protein [Lachnospiraceae bacterium]